jgi:hypothetical protein
MACLSTLACGGGLALSQSTHAADAAPATATDFSNAAADIALAVAIGDAPSPPVPAPAPPTPSGGWLDVSTWPLIPVPLIAVDPDSGVTLGILPTWLKSNDQHEITQIIAPDLLYNANFGIGTHFRIFEYPSTDEQWSVVAFVQQRVQRGFDYEFQKGRLRDSNWSLNTSAIFDRSGTPRFYGIGNNSLDSHVTNYTASQLLAQVQAGYNLNHTWQVQFTLRARRMDVTAGTISKVATIESRYPNANGLGYTTEVLNQVSLIYDTRDDSTVPTRGTQWVAYAGVSGHDAYVSDSVYSVMGLDARTFLPIRADTIVAMHGAIR